MKNNTWNYTVIKAIYQFVLLAFVFMIIFILQCLFSPADEFTVENSHNINILQFREESPLTTIRINEAVAPLSFDSNIKTVYIWTFVFRYLVVTAIALFLLRGIVALSKSYIIDKKRFDIKHEQFLRNAALVVFISSWCLNFVLHLLISFETKTIGLELNHMVFIPGIVLAIVFNIFAEVFKHGIVLQEEYDLTL